MPVPAGGVTSALNVQIRSGRRCGKIAQDESSAPQLNPSATFRKASRREMKF
jgi:hypothetical protein